MTGVLMGTLGSYAVDTGAMELIATETLASASTTFMLANVPSTYKHLQIRISARQSTSGTNGAIQMRVNNLSTSIYKETDLLTYSTTVESGSSIASATSFTVSGSTVTSTAPGGVYSVGIIDIYNYSSTVQGLKLFTSQYGSSTYSAYSGGQVTLASAITSITLFSADSLAAGSSIAIYGIKG